MKIAYLFSRYYPLAVSPFLFWGFLGDHEESVCNSFYHALYACLMPTVRSLILPVLYSLKLRYRPCPHNVSNASFARLYGLVFTPDHLVILMLRSYAFSGRRKSVLVALSLIFFTLVGYVVWVISQELNCSSPCSDYLTLINPRLKPVTALFLIKESSGCFATSNQHVTGAVEAVGAYQLGVRARLSLYVLLTSNCNRSYR